MNKNFIYKLTLSIIISSIFLYSFIGSKGEVVENLDIPVGVGNDLIINENKDIEYSVPFSVYVFEDSGNISSQVLVGKGYNISQTRDNRQLKSNRKFLLGVEKVFLVSEEFSMYGLSALLDIWMNNPQINDNAPLVVCKGKCEDILRHQIPGYPSSSDYIQGIVKNLHDFNFFPKEFGIINLMEGIGSEGINFVVPYLELKENELEITGVALFKGDKMIGKLNMQQTRILNLLKFNKVKGVFSIQKNSKEYINYYAKSTKTVKCYKKDDKYNFIISLNLEGNISSNELYENTTVDAKVLKKLSKNLEDSIVTSSYNFINKCGANSKTDVLSLGKFAAAKYGRHSGVDWNKIVCNSNIEIKVKVHINSEGRGDF